MKATVNIFHGESLIAEMRFEIEGSERDAAEVAYSATQNIHDSWSKPGGRDYDPRMKYIAPLVDGYGHRSTMMGDVVEVNGSEYTVAFFGFDK